MGVRKAALKEVRRKALRKGVAVMTIKTEVRIARGISHAIDDAKWNVMKRERFSLNAPPGI